MRQVRILRWEPTSGYSSVVERRFEDPRVGGSIPSFPARICGSRMVRRWAANSEDGGSTPLRISNRGRGLLAAASECHSDEAGSIPAVRTNVTAGLVFVGRASGFHPDEARSTRAVRTSLSGFRPVAGRQSPKLRTVVRFHQPVPMPPSSSGQDARFSLCKGGFDSRWGHHRQRGYAPICIFPGGLLGEVAVL